MANGNWNDADTILFIINFTINLSALRNKYNKLFSIIFGN